MDSDARRLAERIRQARHRTGLSQRALARALRVTPGAVAHWELAHGAPAAPKLPALADMLGVSLDWLLGRARGDAVAPPGQRTDAAHADPRPQEAARAPALDLDETVAEARRRRWLEENRAALDDANKFIDTHGLWSDSTRLF